MVGIGLKIEALLNFSPTSDPPQRPLLHQKHMKFVVVSLLYPLEITISVYLFTQYISSFVSIANIFSGFFDDIFFKNFHCAVIITTGIP
jgi:hypothetical protein